MIELSINKRPVALEWLRLRDGLGRFPRAEVRLADRCTPIAEDAAARLAVGGQEYSLRVADFWAPDAGSGAWIRLAPAAALTRPYRLAVFSGGQGTTLRHVIETRGPVHGPPELARQVPAAVVDVTLARLLDDTCARRPGWTWWTGPTGTMEIGPPPRDAIEVEGVVAGRRPGGTVVRLTGAVPRPGTEVRLPGADGLLVSLQCRWQPGSLLECIGLVGDVPACRTHPPRSLTRWPARVKRLDPLIVEVIDEEAGGRTSECRGRLMVRRSDSGRFQEQVPLAEGDEVLAELPAGGVSIAPPRVYLWSEGQPATEYRQQSQSKKEVIAEDLDIEARQMRERLERKTTHADRYDIDRP